MILSLLVYLFILIILIISFFLTKKALRWVIVTLITIFFVLPLCFIIFLGVFKIQIQQGKILPQFGPILLILSAPKDIWEPLARDIVVQNKREYNFFITHKYVGSHDVVISFRRLESMEKAEHDFKIRFTVEKDGQLLYDETSQKGWSYWGKEDSGIGFLGYSVPKDLPVGIPLKAKVTIDGDIEGFLEQYGPARIVIRKGSDI